MYIGFIGLGKMGGGLANNLLKAGYSVTVYDVDPLAVERLVAIGARGASNVQEVARSCDTVFTSLPLPTGVETMLIGTSGCMKALPDGATVIDVSTIDPQTARRIADALAQMGRHFLACPLGKGPAQAAEGTEPIFAGGQWEVFEHCRHVLEAVGKPVYYVGDVEQSTAFKLISNLIGMTNMAVLAEGLALGVQAGIELHQLEELLMESGADSYQLRLRGPWILAEDYAPRFSIDLTSKDLRLAVAMARARNAEPRFGALAYETFQQAQVQGLGVEDSAAVYKVFQRSKDGGGASEKH